MRHDDLLYQIREVVRSSNNGLFMELAGQYPPSDLAEALDHVKITDISNLLGLLESEAAAAIFEHFSGHRQDMLVEILPNEQLVNLFKHLRPDVRADIYNRMRHPARSTLLPALAQAERDDLLSLSSYEEGTTGSVTTSEYASIPSNCTVGTALQILRDTATPTKAANVVFVIESGHKLLGSVSLLKLVLAKPDISVNSLLSRNVVFARAEWPKAQAIALIQRYDLVALPVLDREDRMIGVITIENALDISRELDATQLARFGGTMTSVGTEIDILRSPAKRIFAVRVFWLVILTVFGAVTSTFVAAQEELLSQVVILAAFIAPIVDMGGNTGSQAATLVIRSMALGDVTLRWRDILKVISREFPVVLVMGVVIGLLEIVLAYFSKGIGYEVLMVVGLSMALSTMIGGMIGALLPFAAKAMRTDPAALSSPLITSIMDLLGVLIYFALAYLFLADQLRAAVSP